MLAVRKSPANLFYAQEDCGLYKFGLHIVTELNQFGKYTTQKPTLTLDAISM